MNPELATRDSADATEGLDRRRFLEAIPWLGVAWATFVAGVGAAFVGTLRLLFPNLLHEPPTLFEVGFPGDHRTGEIATPFKNRYRAWIVRNERGFLRAGRQSVRAGAGRAGSRPPRNGKRGGPHGIPG